MGGAKYMGGKDEHFPPKDNREVQVQPCTQGRVDSRNPINSHHGGRRARLMKIQGAERTGRHGYPGDNQYSTAGPTTAGNPAIPI